MNTKAPYGIDPLTSLQVKLMRHFCNLAPEEAEKLLWIEDNGKSWKAWEQGKEVMPLAMAEIFCWKTRQGFPPPIDGVGLPE